MELGKGFENMKECVEFGCVGAGIGGGFDHTSELHVMKYGEAMASSDKKHWDDSVVEEHNRMLKHDVFEPTPRSEVP